MAASETVNLWTVRLQDLLETARRTLGRNFTCEQWEQYFPGEAYRETFPDLPARKMQLPDAASP